MVSVGIARNKTAANSHPTPGHGSRPRFHVPGSFPLARYTAGGTRPLARPRRRLTRKMTRKTKKRILAMSVAVPAMPPKPKIAAMIAMMKKMTAQRSIVTSFEE